MLIILAIVIVIAALLIVAYPILAKTREVPAETSPAQEELAELMARRDAVFQALRDLNFDRQVGKIAEEDFVIFEANLKETAAEALRAIDQWEAAADQSLDAAIERLIAERRQAVLRGERTCPTCGQAARPEDKFCAACGTALPSPEAKPAATAGRACPHCGRPCLPTDRFCGACGAALG